MSSIEKVCNKVFRLSRGTQCEIMALHRDTALTRFANNAVSQNVAASRRDYTLRFLDDGRSASVSLNQDSDEAVKLAVRSGLDTLRRQKKDPDLLPLYRAPAARPGKKLYFENTASMTPLYRAEKIKALTRACARAGQTACGTFETGAEELVLANNLGLFARHRQTQAMYSVTVQDRDGSGWYERPVFDAAEIPFEETNETARGKASASRSPKAAAPGHYTVVLEPAAAAELVHPVCARGLGGQTYVEGKSFACGKLGRRLLSPLLTVTDDPRGDAPGMSFDFEGTPKEALTLVEDGVVKNLALDRKNAKKAGLPNNGRALPFGAWMGPLPINIAVKPGRSTTEEIIRDTERGLLVTQFHYTNVLNPLDLTMTGMTRNGTFLIEDGKLKGAVKNLRFTQSAVEALARVDAVGRDTKPWADRGILSCPALRIKDLNFSSATEF